MLAIYIHFRLSLTAAPGLDGAQESHAMGPDKQSCLHRSISA